MEPSSANTGSADELDPQARINLVRAIHDTPTMLVLAVSGGGNAVITDLLDVPGASRTILEVRVPYAASAMADFLGLDNDEPWATDESGGAVSSSTAQTMAEACLERAHALSPNHQSSPEHSLIGVACTAALVTDRPKKGDHRAHIAVASGSNRHHNRPPTNGPPTNGPPTNGPPMKVIEEKIELEKGLRDRAGEDRAVADAVLMAIARTCGVALP